MEEIYQWAAGRPVLLPPDYPSQTDNPYWDEVIAIPDDGFGHWEASWSPPMMTLHPEPEVHRELLVRKYAWAIPSPLTLHWMTGVLQDQPVLEIGAGTGYWAWQLSQLGVDVLAYDIDPPNLRPNGFHSSWLTPDVTELTETFYLVRECNDTAIVASSDPDRVLFLCWPPIGPMPADALTMYGGDMLIFIGEWNTAMHASDEFFDKLDREWVCTADAQGIYTQWRHIHDVPSCWRRR